MTIQNAASPIASKPTGSAWFSGCITIFAILFGMLGIWNVVLGSIVAYVFYSARMLSPASVAILFIIACDCLIYFILAFRIKRQHWIISLVLLILVWFVLPIPLPILINSTSMRLRFSGVSMEPTLSNGSYILADRQAYQQHLPQRGDVIIFQFPLSPTDTLVKRIVGLPGEMVTIDQGQVSIDGTPLNDPYISTQATYSGEWKISDDQYFVLGDNRANSNDSKDWGILPRENILAKAVWMYWPLASFRKIADFDFAR
jgi:signal peptidase I